MVVVIIIIITINTIVYHYAHQPGGSRVVAAKSAARSETSARDFQSRIRIATTAAALRRGAARGLIA